MKKKLFSFLLTLFLIVPCSIIFAACDQEESFHIHNSWDDCLECNEIVHFGNHSLYLDGYNEETGQDIYRCTTCDFVLPQRHKHVFNEYSITPTYHWDVCGVCGFESSQNAVHQYGTTEEGWTSNCTFENGVATCVCIDCGHTKTIDLLTFEESRFGTFEILQGYDNTFIVKPVANPGYHFDRWEIYKEEYNGKSLNLDDQSANYSESIVPLLNIEPRIFMDSIWAYTAIPVFTIAEPVFSDIEVVINAENNVPVEFEYMLYKNDHGTQISYYFPENNNVVLKRITTKHIIDENSAKTHYNSTNYDGGLTLPFSSTCGAEQVLGKCNKVEFLFEDVRNKHQAKVKYDVNGEISDLLADSVIDKTETFIADKYGNLTIEKGAVRYQDNMSNISYYYVDKWIDENGEIVSTSKKFTTKIDKNRTFTAIMKKADEYFEQNGVALLFSKNEEDELTLEAIYSASTAGNIVIPTIVGEKDVIGIGEYAFIPTSLNLYGYFVSSLTIPTSVTKFHERSFHDIGLCDITFEGYKENLRFEMFKNTKFTVYGANYSSALGNMISITANTLNNMIQTFVSSFVDTLVTVESADVSHMGGNILAHYETGTRKLCLLQASSYSLATLSVITYELRHFYQDIALGNVDGLTIDDLKITPTENQVGSWQYLEYPNKDENLDAYWYNAREIDAREFAENIFGCEILQK